MKINILFVSDVDPEKLPLCPYCDQPVEFNAVVVCHQESGVMALAHADCAKQED